MENPGIKLIPFPRAQNEAKGGPLKVSGEEEGNTVPAGYHGRCSVCRGDGHPHVALRGDGEGVRDEVFDDRGLGHCAGVDVVELSGVLPVVVRRGFDRN